MAALYFCALTLFVVLVQSHENCVKSDVVVVQGVGRRSVKTTIAVIRLGIRYEGKTANMVQRKVAHLSTKLVRFLRQQRVMKLRTTGVSLFPRYRFTNNVQRIIGHTGSNTVTFEVPIKTAGRMLDGAVRNGATQISRVSFKASPKATKHARNAALKDAVMAARMEAMTVARAAGVPLGRALRVQITDTFFPQETSVNNFRMRSLARRAAPVTPVIGGDQIINARVSITYDSYAYSAKKYGGLRVAEAGTEVKPVMEDIPKEKKQDMEKIMMEEEGSNDDEPTIDLKPLDGIDF